MKPFRISRRALLRGLAATLPLPLLDVMTPVSAFAQAITPAEGIIPKAIAPTRYLYLYQGNGFYPKAWNPEGNGKDFILPPTLASWQPFKDKVTIIRNLNTIAFGPHIGKVSALLTGHQAERDTKTGRFMNPKTVDQVIADKIGNDTLYRSISAGIEHPGLGYCSGINMPVSMGSSISWNNNAPVQPEVSPRNLFDMLFRRGGAEAKERAGWQRSILDKVLLEEASALQKRASSIDKHKVEEYLDSVRTVERRMQASVLTPNRAWTPPTHPDEEEFVAPPPGVPTDRREHCRQMMDVLALALWTDSTRVSTFMFANELSEGDFRFLGSGITASFHNTYSHHGQAPEKVAGYKAINTFHAEHVAYLASKLDSIQEDDGRTLLDNCALFFGSGLKDGNGHVNVDLPVALIGSAGGRFKPAGHIQAPVNTNVANLHLTALGWFDIDLPDFNGFSTGKIKEIA